MSDKTADVALDILDKHEADCILPVFNADVAWEIGSLIRENALAYPQPVAIDITGSNSQLYFRCLSRPGANLDNQYWIARKQKTVLRFARASFYMGCKLRRENRTMDSMFGVNQAEYAVHGGAFPIRVRGTEGVIAVATVSGLRQDLDHYLVVDSIKQYLINLKLMETTLD